MDSLALLPPSVQDDRGKAFLACCLQAAAMPLDILSIYDPDSAPASVLPALAAQLDLMGQNGWSLATTVAERRALLKEAILLHRRKGTPWSIKRAMALVGWTDLQLFERLGAMPYDGAITYNGAQDWNSGSRWAEFRAYQPLPDRPVSTAELAMVRAAIEAWAPKRCHLESIQFGLNFQTGIRLQTGHYDGSSRYDGWVEAEGDTIQALSWIGIGQGAPTFRKHFLPDGVDTSVLGRITISWILDTTESNAVAIDTLALFTEGGQEVIRVTRAPIYKSEDMSLAGSWTLVFQEEGQ